MKNISSVNNQYIKDLSLLKNKKNRIQENKYIIEGHHLVEEAYKASSNSFISKKITFGNKKGYLEINEQENSKYLIEIMYNYAKIEVMVDEYDINKAVTYAVSILSSITYNDSVISNLMGEDVLNFTEEEFNIFETVLAETLHI